MRFISLLCGALRASEVAPVIDRLEVTTYITQYVVTAPPPAAWTTTVTETVGILATPIVHSPPVPSSTFLAAQARTPANPFNYTTLPKRSDSSSAMSFLSTAGQWITELITLIDVFKILFWLSAIISFMQFFQDKANRYYMQAVIYDLGRAYRTNCVAIWTVIWWLVHNFAYGAHPLDPMHALAFTAARLEAESPTYLVSLLFWTTKWWGNHSMKGYSVFAAVWKEVGPGLEECCHLLLRRLGQFTAAMPAYIDRGLDFSGIVMGKGFEILRVVSLSLYNGVLLPPYGLLCWIATKLYPTRLLHKLRFYLNKYRLQMIVQQPSVSRQIHDHYYEKAANLSLDEIVALYYALSDEKLKFANFQNGQAKELAEKCVAYRASILALVKDVNWYRQTWDAVANYLHNTRLNRNPYGITAQHPYRCSRLVFLPNANAQGFHYDVDPSSRSRLPLRSAFTQNAPVEFRGRKFRNYAFNSHVVNAGLVPHALDLFQENPWCFEANFPGIKLPAYDAKDNPFDMKNRRPMPRAVQEEKFGEMIEDCAAKGKLLGWGQLSRKTMAGFRTQWKSP